MQVNSQTCSCGMCVCVCVCGRGRRVQNQPFSHFLLPYLPTQPVEKAFSDSAKRSWHQFPHSAVRHVSPPSYTSGWSPTQQHQQQQQRSRPAGWAVRAANYIRRHRQQQLCFLSWRLLREQGRRISHERTILVFTHSDEAALSEHLRIRSLRLGLCLQETKARVCLTQLSITITCISIKTHWHWPVSEYWVMRGPFPGEGLSAGKHHKDHPEMNQSHFRQTLRGRTGGIQSTHRYR